MHLQAVRSVSRWTEIEDMKTLPDPNVRFLHRVIWFAAAMAVVSIVIVIAKRIAG